jgi:hypothetical protein
MSGFSPEWLALREPADIAARNRRVLESCRRAFSQYSDLIICDMGAGTGASVRAFADLLPRRQDWILVDHDPRNLSAAIAALSAWSGDRDIRVRTHHQDFAQTPACWPEDAALITASALLDLSSHAWIDAFVTALAARGLPLLATLTVDGAMAAAPGHPLDSSIFAAFRKHQASDKGFGPAAGGAAAVYLERRLMDAGYTVEAGESPWIIDRASAALLTELLTGIAGAARETGELPAKEIDEWLGHRIAHTRTLTIGHRDVFAWREKPERA